jgi:hypothetical protein
LSPNTGDQIIGLTFLRHTARAEIGSIAPVSIGRSIRDRYDLLVIGGGEVLHPAGHPFYDVFRVPGRHILNTAGTSGPLDAAYLNDYRLVSVRSAMDLENLEGFAGAAKIVPCLSVLFDEVCEPSPDKSGASGSVGVHLQAASMESEELSPFMGNLKGKFEDPIRMFPFTIYNHDRSIEEILARALDLPAPIDFVGPDEAFQSIRRFRAVITSSLHATIMAYIAGVPFLAFAYADKVRAFLDERNLSQRILGTPEEIDSKMDLLESESVHWDEELERDRSAARAILGEIHEEVEAFSSSGSPKGEQIFDLWVEPTHPKGANQLLMSKYSEYGERFIDSLRHSIHLATLESWTSQLGRGADETQTELDRLSAYCKSLRVEIENQALELRRAEQHQAKQRKEIRNLKRVLSDRDDHEMIQNQQVESSTAYCRHLENELEQRKAEILRAQEHRNVLSTELERMHRATTELGNYIKHLEDALAEHRQHQDEVASYVRRIEQELAKSRTEPESHSLGSCQQLESGMPNHKDPEDH